MTFHEKFKQASNQTANVSKVNKRKKNRNKIVKNNEVKEEAAESEVGLTLQEGVCPSIQVKKSQVVRSAKSPKGSITEQVINSSLNTCSHSYIQAYCTCVWSSLSFIPAL